MYNLQYMYIYVADRLYIANIIKYIEDKQEPLNKKKANHLT